jgi:hypothetical protein
VELFHFLRRGKRGKTARIVLMRRIEKSLAAASLDSRPISLWLWLCLMA